MIKYNYLDNDKFKCIRSENYNFDFDKTTGFFARWGKTKDDDPTFSPFGPEILDLEISINGCPNNCSHCYKKNQNIPPTNMSLDTYKKIIGKFDRSPLCQIALGICGVKTNPDFIDMLKYTREKGLIPNFTLSGIDCDDNDIKEIVKYIGACAVSVYESDKNICYNTVEKFISAGIKQTNIHLLVMKENINFVYEVLNDVKNDKRLKDLNAIVLLKLKPKGRAKNIFTNLSQTEYNKLFKFCFDNNISIGMDSCHAHNLELFLEQSDIKKEEKENISKCIESCESFGLFSSYINYKGKYFPCSFTENEGEWKDGIDVLNFDNFLKDIWFSEKLNKYRQQSIDTRYESGCRKCLTFDID